LQREVPVSIEVDIYDWLKTRSTFEDTVSTVLRRELGLPEPSDNGEVTAAESARVAADASPSGESHSGSKPARRQKTKRRRAAAGTLLPESEYLRPILEVLDDSGGSAPKQVVIDEVGKRLTDRLTEADREELDSGGIRWQSRVQFARLRLADRGFIDKNARRGTWAITPEGTTALKEGTI
jgi:hypothetical protein